MVRYFFILFMLSLAIFEKGFGHQKIDIHELKESWHHSLHARIRHFSTSGFVKSYQVHPNIHVYEPPDYKRSIIWVTGNGFVFEEPESHDAFLEAFAEKTNSKIFAISHQKLPKVTYSELKAEVLDVINLLFKQEYLSLELPIVLAGDSSGPFIIKDLLSELLSQISIDQLLFIAPIFDMKCFLEDSLALKSFPEAAHDEILNQYSVMQFLASLLYPDPLPREDSEKLEWIENFQNIPNLPKIHVVCFEYDVFFPQALQLKNSIPNITLEVKENCPHGHYLLRDVNDPLQEEHDFIFSLSKIFSSNKI